VRIKKIFVIVVDQWQTILLPASSAFRLTTVASLCWCLVVTSVFATGLVVSAMTLRPWLANGIEFVRFLFVLVDAAACGSSSVKPH
jgi:hypothetical protein